MTMGKFNPDQDHTAAHFSVRHMMVTLVHGSFTKMRGTLHFDPDDVAKSSVEAETGVSSIYTGVDRRDDDLKSPNYFDAATYPTITFRSTGTEVVAQNDCLVHGNLTIKGITKPVILNAHFEGPSHFQDDDRLYTTYSLRATVMVNREDFGMTRNLEIENKGVMVGKHAYLTIDAKADLVDE
jgi:polyisoprenoid-binding protein YceI